MCELPGLGIRNVIDRILVLLFIMKPFFFISVLPRILFDKFTEKDYSQLLTYRENRNEVITLIIETCKKYNFDGIVLEVWSELSARVDDEYLINLVKETAIELKKRNFQTILVIPPTRKETYDLFSRKHFEILYPFIHAFSLMTYDFSNVQRPGANAPLHWVKHAIQHICPDDVENVQEKRSKILMVIDCITSLFSS